MSHELKSLTIERQHFAVVSQFAAEILSLNSSEDLVWHLAKNVVARLGFEDVVIYLLNADNELEQKAAFGNKNPEEYTVLDPINIKLGQGVVGMAAYKQQPILLKDTRDFPDYIVDDQPRLSELAVPMIADGKLLGVIDSEHSELGFYSVQDQKTLVAIASIAATKLVNNLMVSELQESLQHLEYSSKIQDALFEIAELIFETDDLDQFYARLHQCIGRLTFAKNFFIALRANEGKALRLVYCVDELDDVPRDEIIPLDNDQPSITAYVMQTNRPLLLFEADIEKMMNDNKIYLIGSLPKAWLGVPFGEGDLQGVVVVQSYSDNYHFQTKDQQLLMFVAKHIRNAIERMQAKYDLRFMALHDPLTKLPNRILFTDRLNQAMVKTKRDRSTCLALLFLDLDKFKYVNDNYGHYVGDQLLIALAETIGSCLRESDTYCRLGGDEFAILLENLPHEREAKRIAEKIVNKLQAPIEIKQRQIAITTSIGIASFRGGDVNAETLLVRADDAMYQAKIHGRNQVYSYSDTNKSAHVVSHKVEREFIPALQNSQLFLEFQPIIDLNSGDISCAEALIRWRHPLLGLIPPDQFISELERSGHIIQLDEFVLQTALDYLNQWQSDLPEDFRICINISSAGFCSDKLIEKLTSIHQTSPEVLTKLCIEITEESIVNDVEKTQGNINSLREMGVLIALDDFGTGFSSLSYLHQFRFDVLKIDRSFITDIENSREKSIILETIINLAKALAIRTTAEGIETQGQFEILKNMQCTQAQGFYMSPSISGNKLLSIIHGNTRLVN